MDGNTVFWRDRKIIMAPEAVKILQLVEADLGCNFVQIQEKTGLNRYAFDKALESLIKEGCVRVILHGRQKILIPDMPESDELAHQIGALNNKDAQTLYRFFCDGGEIMGGQEIIERAKQDLEWDEPKARWELRRLEEAKLLKAFRGFEDRRRVMYRRLAAHPVVQRIIDMR